MGAPIVDIDPPEGGALQTAKDLFSGAVGGVAQVLIGTARSIHYLFPLLLRSPKLMSALS